MASRIAGFTDTQNLDGILFTSKFNKIPKSPAALRHTSNMSFLAITNLDKIMQFEVRYAEVRKAHDALLLFMANTPGRYTYRPRDFYLNLALESDGGTNADRLPERPLVVVVEESDD